MTLLLERLDALLGVSGQSSEICEELKCLERELRALRTTLVGGRDR